MLPTLKPIACCEVILLHAANNKPIKTELHYGKDKIYRDSSRSDYKKAGVRDVVCAQPDEQQY